MYQGSYSKIILSLYHTLTIFTCHLLGHFRFCYTLFEIVDRHTNTRNGFSLISNVISIESLFSTVNINLFPRLNHPRDWTIIPLAHVFLSL